MPKPEFKNRQAYTFSELHSSASEDIKDLILDLQNSQKILTKFINLEVCVLAETIDNFLPGFWNRFLKNRRQALKQFLEYKENCPDENHILLNSAVWLEKESGEET